MWEPEEVTLDEVLLQAATDGDLEGIRTYLGAGADLEARGPEDERPLHCAARAGRVGAIGLLLRRGAAIDAADVFGGTPLLQACRTGRVGAASALLEAGADKDWQDGSGLTALHCAVKAGSVDVLKLLLDAGVEVDKGRVTPLLRACCWANMHPERDRSSTMIRLLIDAGANVHVKGAQGHSALYFACSHGCTSAVRALLEAGAKCNDEHELGGPVATSPLHAACSSGVGGVVKLLISAGANVDLPDVAGYTPLCIACEAAAGYEIVEMLLCAGADVRRGSSAGKPIALAIARRSGALLLAGLLERWLGIRFTCSVLCTRATKAESPAASRGRLLRRLPTPVLACALGML